MGTKNFVKMVALESALKDMVSLEWGSEEQIEAENTSFNLSADLFGVDWDDHPYLLKATTAESANYIRKTVFLPSGG